jgi:hypothetical protein
MSKRIFAAILGAGIAACLAAPAEARLDNGPIASLYDGDTRPSLSQQKIKKTKRAEWRGSKSKKAKAAYRKSNKRNTATASRTSRLKGRAMTAMQSGGGAGTSRSCLQGAARALLERIEQQFGPVQVVSTCRPGAVIAGSGKPSKHRYGLAVDFDAGSRKQAIVNWLIANHHNGGTMTYARMSHIHFDIGQHFVQLGAGGGRRRG